MKGSKTKGSVHMSWAGFKELTVVKVKQENYHIKSYYLKANDGEMPNYKPGQFLPIQVEIDGTPQMRRYTLSGNPEQSGEYRLTIKREPNGVVSNYFHDHIHEGDTIKAMPPFGKFCLDENTERPIVLLGGGIGVTPMLSMLYRAVSQKKDIHFVYGATQGDHLVLTDEIEALKQQHPFHYDILLSQPTDEDKKNQIATHEQRVSAEWIEMHLPLEAEFYFCGPVGFMETIKTSLIGLGVPEERIHYEFFGKKAF